MTRGCLLINTLYLSCALLSCLAAPTFANNIAWKAASSGTWSVGTNWVGNQAPGPGDVAVIAQPGTYDVNINGNVSVGGVSLGSTGSPKLHVNNATLTTTAGVSVGSSSVLELNTATLSGGGITLNGTLSSSGTSNVNAAVTTATSSTITVGVGTLTVANGFSNRGLLSFPTSGNRDLYVTTGTLTNTTTGTIASTSLAGLHAALDNQGAVTVSGTSSRLILQQSGASHTGSGSITISGANCVMTLSLAGSSFSTSGNVSVASTCGFFVLDGAFHQTSGTVSGAGSLTLGSTTAATFASNPTVSTMWLGGAGMVFPSTLVNGAAQALTIGPAAEITAPAFTNQFGYTLNFTGSTATFHVPNFTNLGELFCTRHILLDGNLNLGPLSNIEMYIGGSQPFLDYDWLEVTGGVTLNGTLTFHGQPSPTPIPGDTYDPITAVDRFGDFAQIVQPTLPTDFYAIVDPTTRSASTNPYRIRIVRQKWTQLNPVGGFAPVARRGASAVYVPFHNEVIIFGGQASNGQMLNDVWMLENPDGQAGPNTFWHPITTTGTPPSPRKGHTAVYDAFNHRMIVFGGENDSSAYFSDIWILDEPDGATRPATWIPFPSVPGVSPRSGHGAGYNPTSNRMVVSQGNAYCDPSIGEMWTLDHANGLGTSTGWTLWSIPGTPPSSRRDAIYAYDVNGNRLLVYGGRTPCGAVKTDAFALSNADGTPDVYTSWSQLGSGTSPALPGLYGAPGGYDPLFDRLVMFGGMKADGTTFSSSVFLLANTRTNAGWTELPLPGTRPAARAFHSMVYRPDGKRWIMFGGDANGDYMNDVWTLDLDGDAPQVSGVGSGPGASQKPRVLAFSASPSPNPSSHGMGFSVQALENTDARIAIYDALGRMVVELHDGPITAGEHRFAWTGNVASGIYFVLAKSGSTEDVRRVVVTR